MTNGSNVSTTLLKARALLCSENDVYDLRAWLADALTLLVDEAKDQPLTGHQLARLRKDISEAYHLAWQLADIYDADERHYIDRPREVAPCKS